MVGDIAVVDPVVMHLRGFGQSSSTVTAITWVASHPFLAVFTKGLDAFLPGLLKSSDESFIKGYRQFGFTAAQCYQAVESALPNNVVRGWRLSQQSL